MTKVSIFIRVCIYKTCRFCLNHKIIKRRLNTSVLFCDCIFFYRNIIQSNICFKIFFFKFTWLNSIFKGKSKECIFKIFYRICEHSIYRSNNMGDCSIKLKFIFLRFRTVIVHCLIISGTTICKSLKRF